jgi:D-alanyl-lipoteichoic acid acyltransferase DltB (MBOAT superfamily)
MLLGGLWHGASWLFVIWGGLHGGFLAVERLLRHWGQRLGIQPTSALSRNLVWLLTLGLLCITWVFFRSSDFGATLVLLKAMLGLRGGGLLTGGEIRQALAVMVPLLLIQRQLRRTRLRAILLSWPWPLRSLGLAALLVALCLAPGDDRAFIYFQF